jgi:hypothetical protein
MRCVGTDMTLMLHMIVLPTQTVRQILELLMWPMQALLMNKSSPANNSSLRKKLNFFRFLTEWRLFFVLYFHQSFNVSCFPPISMWNWISERRGMSMPVNLDLDDMWLIALVANLCTINRFTWRIWNCFRFSSYQFGIGLLLWQIRCCHNKKFNGD